MVTRMKGKGKGQILIERYLHSKSLLELVVDWQEPMVLQRKLRPSIARVNVQLDPWHAASKHTTAPINHNKPSPRKLSPDGAARARKHTSDYSLLLSLSTSKG